MYNDLESSDSDATDFAESDTDGDYSRNPTIAPFDQSFRFGELWGCTAECFEPWTVPTDPVFEQQS